MVSEVAGGAGPDIAVERTRNAPRRYRGSVSLFADQTTPDGDGFCPGELEIVIEEVAIE